MEIPQATGNEVEPVESALSAVEEALEITDVFGNLRHETLLEK
jgi:hypothetical protein